jgi:hypothetical protein
MMVCWKKRLAVTMRFRKLKTGMMKMMMAATIPHRNKAFEVMELAEVASDPFSSGHAPGILYSWYSGLRPELG